MFIGFVFGLSAVVVAIAVARRDYEWAVLISVLAVVAVVDMVGAQ